MNPNDFRCNHCGIVEPKTTVEKVMRNGKETSNTIVDEHCPKCGRLLWEVMSASQTKNGTCYGKPLPPSTGVCYRAFVKGIGLEPGARIVTSRPVEPEPGYNPSACEWKQKTHSGRKVEPFTKDMFVSYKRTPAPKGDYESRLKWAKQSALDAFNAGLKPDEKTVEIAETVDSEPVIDSNTPPSDAEKHTETDKTIEMLRLLVASLDKEVADLKAENASLRALTVTNQHPASKTTQIRVPEASASVEMVGRVNSAFGTKFLPGTKNPRYFEALAKLESEVGK